MRTHCTAAAVVEEEKRAENDEGQVQIGGQVFHYTRPLLLLFGFEFLFQTQQKLVPVLEIAAVV